MQILNDKRHKELKNINLGSGRLQQSNYCNLDIVGYVDNGGKQTVDIIIDIEKEKLPYDDNSIEIIKADNVFEHLGEGFIFALNECHRVLKDGCILDGCVPVAGTRKDFMDITHKRHFLRESFGYICGINLAKKNLPKHPKYADYQILPWIEIELIEKDDMIFFKMFPRKI